MPYNAFGLTSKPKEVPITTPNEVLYHVTLGRNVDSILHRGLQVGQRGVLRTDIDDPDVNNRIYLTDKDGAEMLADNITMTTPPRTKVAVFEISVLPANMQVYKEVPSTDPVWAVYIRQRLPKQYLKLVYKATTARSF